MGELGDGFEELQAKLAALWPTIRELSQHDQTIVVVPSVSLEFPAELAPLVPSYEERLLFLLLLLRQPHARLIYVTSQPVLPRLVDYFLGLVPGLDSPATRERLFMLSAVDPSPRPLTAKILDRPRLVDRIRRLIPDRDRAHLVPYTTSDLERQLAVDLGIPMYGADPTRLHFGTKSGSRELFAQAGVPHPRGVERIHSFREAAVAVGRILDQHPSCQQVVVKLDASVGGSGNGIADVRASDGVAVLEARLRNMSFEFPSMTSDEFEQHLADEGGIVEERITGAEIRSPSVQLRVTPDGEVQLLSTHDQVLGGAAGQSYEGCCFPADSAYAPAISQDALAVGKALAGAGVLGRFAVDFVVSRDEDATWRHYAIEVNLRKGGTTHPFLTLQLLTDGTYDGDRAVFTDEGGHEKHYVASDHVDREDFRRLTPDDLFDAIESHLDLRWDAAHRRGVVFHMVSGLAVAGRLGLTAVGDSPADARLRYERALAALPTS